MTTVVTAMYGRFDVLRTQATQDVDCDWICFTDDPDLMAPAPWQVVPMASRFVEPRMAAKVHKMCPLVDDPDVVWIDASMEVTSPSFVRSSLAARHDGIAVHTHPRRDCIYTEAEASIGAEAQGGKYDSIGIGAQAAAYFGEGHPEHGGLNACGVVAWKLPVAATLGRAWLAECERWTPQDQISFPVVCRRLGVTPGVLPWPQIEGRRPGFLYNRAYRIHPHRVVVG